MVLSLLKFHFTNFVGETLEGYLWSSCTCFRCKAAFFGGIDLDILLWIASLEFFEKFWHTEYRQDRIFFRMFILMSLLPFKQESVHLFWNSCKPVTNIDLDVHVNFITTFSAGASWRGLNPPLYGQSVKLEKFLSMH